MSHNAYVKFFGSLFLGMLWIACDSRKTPTTTSPSPNIAPTSRDQLEEDSARQWKLLQARQTCNLLNGCQPAKDIVALGPDVAAQAATNIIGLKQAPFWRIELLRSLRFVRDHRVQSAQKKMLHDKAWPIRAYAAVGLGYARDHTFFKKLKSLSGVESNYGAQIGYLWALTTMDPRLGRTKLVEHLMVLPESRDIRVHLVALDAIRSIKLVELRTQVHSWLKHRNFFVIRDAVRTVSDLHDRSAIPLLIPLLDHEQPMVQRASLACLRRFTGLKHARKKPAFEKWCEKFCRPAEGSTVPGGKTSP